MAAMVSAFDLVGEGFAVDAAGVVAVVAGSLVKGRAIVPSGRCRAAAGCWPLEEDSERGRTCAKAGGNARRQPVAGRSTDDEDFLRAVEGGLAFDPIDLVLDGAGAAIGMGRSADEAANFGLDDHGISLG